MIKHSITNDLLHVSIDNMDFSYRIPVKKLGKTMKWTIGKNGDEGIEMKNVSKWALQIFTKKPLDEKYLDQFQKIIQEIAVGNSIDWKETKLAVNVQQDYAQLKSNSKMSEKEIISILEEKYKLP